MNIHTSGVVLGSGDVDSFPGTLGTGGDDRFFKLFIFFIVGPKLDLR